MFNRAGVRYFTGLSLDWADMGMVSVLSATSIR